MIFVIEIGPSSWWNGFPWDLEDAVAPMTVYNLFLLYSGMYSILCHCTVWDVFPGARNVFHYSDCSFFVHSIPSPMFFNNILRCLRIYLRCNASIHLKVSSSIGTSSNGRSACQLPSQGSCKTEAACPYTRPDTNLGVGADIGPMIYD